MKEENEILKELNGLKSGLGAASRVMPFEVPQDYFGTLAGQLAQDTWAAEGTTPDLTISKEMPHGVPVGYFENLPAQLLSSAKTADAGVRKGRVIPFVARTGKVVRFAAAAMLVLGLGFGSYRFFQLRTPDGRASHKLAKVDPDSLHSYVLQHLDDFDDETLENAVVSSQTDVHTAVSSLNDMEIEDFLNGVGDAAQEPKHVE